MAELIGLFSVFALLMTGLGSRRVVRLTHNRGPRKELHAAARSTRRWWLITLATVVGIYGNLTLNGLMTPTASGWAAIAIVAMFVLRKHYAQALQQ